MRPSNQLRIISALGGRRAHRWLSNRFGQELYDFWDPERYPAERLLKEKELSRYYTWANFFRAGIYVPILKGLYGTGHWFSFALVAFLIGFHLVCVLGELFKMASVSLLLANSFVAEGGPDWEEINLDTTPPPLHWYFSPKRFETERIYRAFGFDEFRSFVTWYTDMTQLTKEERQAGKHAEHMEPTLPGMISYEKTTRQAESMHLLAGGFNVAPLVSFLLLHRLWLSVWVAFVLLIDIALVLLQRYHRTRVLSRIEKVIAHRERLAI